jgi:hypothetical protein
MATRNEKIGFTLAGFLIGGTYNLVQKYNKATENNQEYGFLKGLGHFLLGGAVGAPIGRLAAEVFGTPNDTVNYKCYDTSNKVVYTGVAFEDRVEKRMDEHRMSGKVFCRTTSDIAKPRCEALAKERRMILRHRPKYNVVHNSY